MTKLVWLIVLYYTLYPEVEPYVILEPFDTFEECKTEVLRLVKNKHQFVSAKCVPHQIQIDIEKININDLVLYKET